MPNNTSATGGYLGNRSSNILELGRGMRVNRFPPQPPAGVRITGGILYWEVPADGIGITHWRLYANNDANASLVREIPVGQLSFKDGLVAARAFLSAWSQPFEKESRRVLANDPSGSGLTGVGDGSDSIAYPDRS